MNLKLDFKKVFVHFLAVKLRGEKMVAWVESMLTPLQSLHDQFSVWAYDLRYDLSFSGQQIYLEHLLNDVFDASERRIYIDDPLGTIQLSEYIFNKVESQPDKILYNKSEGKKLIIYNRSEINVSTDDFVIHVPSTVFNQISMSRIVDKYRQAGKIYSFQTF